MLKTEGRGADRKLRPATRGGSKFLRGIAFVAPALIIYLLFIVYPLIKSLWGSLFSWRGVQQGEFTGLGNFTRLFDEANITRVTGAFTHNVLWFIGILIVQNLLGLVIAYILYTRGPKFTFFQTAFFFPAILSPVLVGALWRLLLSPGGPVEVILRHLGIVHSPITWLGNSSVALWVLIFVDIWNWVGLPILVFLAGFHAINPEIFEAAKLDGARTTRTIRSIALPLLIPSISTLTILTFINTFNQFDIVYVMEGVSGDPAYSTDVLVTYFYRLAFGSVGAVGITDIGLALALATLLFLFLVIGSGVAMRYFNRRAAALG